MIGAGRYTARIEGDFVVFLIGARINRLWRVDKWVPVAKAMPKMIAELMRQPELGLLHADSYLSGRTVMTVQYWRSFEHLHAYAHARDKAHLPAWAAFNRAAKGDDSVGVFHESYVVKAGQYECVYVNIPPLGAAKVGTVVEATGRMEGARGRMGS